MKTKYKKVQVSERLPEDNVDVIMIDEFGVVGEGKRSGDNWWSYGAVLEGSIEYWLEEVPDMEDEMREMLERIINAFETDYVIDGEIVDKPYEWLQDVYKETKSLLTKLKTNNYV